MAARKAPTKKSAGIVKPEPEAMAAVRTTMVPIRIGQRTYEAVRDPRCNVCTHPGRVKIEERILFHDGYREIAEWVSNHDVERFDGVTVVWPEVTPKDLARHFRGNHCPIDSRVLHELQTQETGELDYEAVAGRVVNHMVFARQTIARVTERAARGEIEPGYREALASAKLIAAVEQAAKDNDREDRSWFYEQAFEIYFGEAKKIMTDQQWAAFSDALTQNTLLRQLTERAQNPDVTDAEIIEETA